MPNLLAYLQQLLAQDEPSSMADQQPGLRTDDIALPVPARDRMPRAWSPQLERQIWAAAEAAGIDPELGDRLVRTESSYNPLARSKAGAVGLTQLMPDTALDMGVTDRTDPAQSLQRGFGYLKPLIDRYNGDVEKALMAYNWGPGNVAKAVTTPPTGRAARGQRQARAYAAKVGGSR